MGHGDHRVGEAHVVAEVREAAPGLPRGPGDVEQVAVARADLDELVGDWSALMEHEALWIVECDVETNESRSEQMRACTVPFPESYCPATTRTSTEDSAMNSATNSAMNSAIYSATDSTCSTTGASASTYTNPEDQPAIGYASSD